METKFTKGPWRTGHDGHGGMFVESIDYQIGFVSTASGAQKENAALIAAAPELLEALQCCLTLLEAENKRYYRDGEWNEVAKARAAIAKATGGAR